MKGYSEKEMKRILRQDLVLPEEVNDKVYGAYSSLSGQEYWPARTRSYRNGFWWEGCSYACSDFSGSACSKRIFYKNKQ